MKFNGTEDQINNFTISRNRGINNKIVGKLCVAFDTLIVTISIVRKN
jgi:hypothetical protein